MTAPFGAHFFRHEYGRLVAMLVRRVGARHLEAIEDAVQAALLAAVESWPRSVAPDNPSAWLYRVAHNQLAGELRRGTRQGALAVEHARAAGESTIEAPFVPLAGDVRDDFLRMLFVCCDDAVRPPRAPRTHGHLVLEPGRQLAQVSSATHQALR